MKVFDNPTEKEFLFITTSLAFVIGILYVWKGILEGFEISTIIISILSFLYIPVLWIFRRPGFIIFGALYVIILIFIIAFVPTYLFNNFTGIMAVLLLIMAVPKIKWISFISYLVVTSIAFALNTENLCRFLIHTATTFWIFHIFNFVLQEKYTQKKLILFDDERKILTELSKNRLQKAIELEGFSESTIYRRIKAACARNKMTKAQLLEEFKKEITPDK